MSNYKNTEKLLRNYKANQLRLKNIDREIDLIREDDGLSAMTYDSIGGSSNSISDSTFNTANSNIIKQEKLNKEKARLETSIKKIDEALCILNETEQTIIKEFYINNKIWWQVAAVVAYSERHCKNIRRKAVQTISKAIFG